MQYIYKYLKPNSSCKIVWIFSDLTNHAIFVQDSSSAVFFWLNFLLPRLQFKWNFVNKFQSYL